MLLTIDPTGTEAIYLQLRRQIILGIATGKLKKGEQLPSVRQLADELGVNTMTISKAYNLLKEEHYLITDRRKGTTVTLPTQMSQNFQRHFEEEIALLLAEAVLNGCSKEAISKKISTLLTTFS